MSFKRVGCEILTNFNILLMLADGFYYQNFSLKYYGWINDEFKIPKVFKNNQTGLPWKLQL